ncbi:hypothetical protein CC80DRAFT_508177 [Byssothecium circinans]|uniref:Uncharacterized protein n=1 Tax=Byssothecium circinans TaxID=147558 RepID=A0A6A5TK82_9PLEO|nr:hypothetical protein CC80DRAFT_508177 [Byssothecium circinans]
MEYTCTQGGATGHWTPDSTSLNEDTQSLFLQRARRPSPTETHHCSIQAHSRVPGRRAQAGRRNACKQGSRGARRTVENMKDRAIKFYNKYVIKQGLQDGMSQTVYQARRDIC